MTADHSVLNPLEGEIFVVDKPLGWSSFHVVKKLRGALTARLRKAGVRKLKVGHAGTLDPLATGVMILCTGKATKRIDELQAGVKEYIAEIRLGLLLRRLTWKRLSMQYSRRNISHVRVRRMRLNGS